MLPLIPSFIISTWIFLIHLRILIFSTSLLLPFTSSFIISALLLLLQLLIPTSYSSLMLSSLHCGMFALKFELEVLIVAQLVWVVLFTKQAFLGQGLDLPSSLLFLAFFSLFSFSTSAALSLLN